MLHNRAAASLLSLLLCVIFCTVPVMADRPSPETVPPSLCTEPLPSKSASAESDSLESDSAEALPLIRIEATDGVYAVIPDVDIVSGAEIDFSAELSENYVLRGIDILDAEGRPVIFNVTGEYRYSFVKPESGVTVSLKAQNFAPVTRAQCALEIWRLAGNPVVNYFMRYEDVDPEADYAEAVRWAASEGFMLGEDELTFNPDKTLNREELATIIYRVAKKHGMGFAGMWMFRLDVTDREFISEWAFEPVCWSVMHNIIERDCNVPGYFEPQCGVRMYQLTDSLDIFGKMLAEKEESNKAQLPAEPVNEAPESDESTDESTDKSEDEPTDEPAEKPADGGPAGSNCGE